MSGTVRKIIVLALSACLLSIVQSAFLPPVSSTPDTVLSFSPPHVTVQSETSFYINVSLTNCPSFSFFDVIVTYNVSMLNGLNASISVPWWWSGFATINESGGSVELYGYSTLALSGNVTLGTIGFKSLMQGNSTLDFQTAQVKYGSIPITLTANEGQVESIILSLTLATNARFYFKGQNVTTFGNITAAGEPADALVGIEARSPDNDTVAIRTMTAGTVPSNSLWKVNITNFYPCDQYGNLANSFAAGTQASFFVAVQNLWNQTFSVLVAVNVYDSFGGTVGFNEQQTAIAPFSTGGFYVPVYIPPTTINGTATACAGIYSAKPSEGGYPYSFENSTSFLISSDNTTPPVVPPVGGSSQAVFNFTFRPSSWMGMGEFTIYASATYRDLYVSARARFAYVNLWVSKTDPAANYTTVQAAVNGANNTNAIYVSQGTYNENVNIGKTSLTIIGDYDNSTNIDGGSADNVLIITAPYVRIIDFNIMNSSTTAGHDSGIMVSSSSCDLINNNITINDIGITIGTSNFTNIIENNISNNTNGILVENANFTNIIENSVYNNTNGISINNSSYTSINNNLIANNSIGLQLLDTAFTDVVESQIVSNNQGVILEGTLSHDNNLGNNNVSANLIGIEFHLATNNSVTDSNIANNLGFGIEILDADNNTITGNDFIANSVQVYSNATSNQFDAGYPSGGNYWSGYTGSDLYSGAYQNQSGSDGIGDVPYSFDVNCTDKYPFVKPSYWQDVGITNLLSKFPPSMKTVLGQNYNDSISVRVINYGGSIWVSNVALYANTTIIDQKTVTLQGRSFTTLNFIWNGTGFVFGNYTIRALFSSPQADMNTTNNQYILEKPVTLTIPGDLHSQFFLVNGVDLNTFLVSYGGKPDGTGPRPYNPNCDFYELGRIKGPELNLLLSHYGQHYP